jgi:predicted dehydrogenase
MVNEISGKRIIGRQSRRDFLKATAVSAGAVILAGARLPSAYAAGSDTIKVGVIGCGGRGTGAAADCLTANAGGVQIWSMGDLFKDRLDGAHAGLSKKFPDKARFDVPGERQFSGWDNHEKVIASGVDMIITATPPGFRPMILKAAIDAGKHVFMEKPVAVDPIGIRSVIVSSANAETKKLAIVAGTQRRHEPVYVETIKRIHDGMIGELVSAQCYWNQGLLWVHQRKSEYSDMEWQVRNWLYFTWLSGDHIVEQHVHNLDVVNWAFNSMPALAYGMGGRAARTSEDCGNIYDHFTVEFEYENKARTISMCRQTDKASPRIGERVVGTKGCSDCCGNIWDHKGGQIWKYDGPSPDPYVREHADLVASIRAGKPLNEGKRIAESTLTAIAGRMSAYTGRALKLDWALKSSKLDLVPKNLAFGPLPAEPVCMPGKTELV